jgi:AcrR family transcriptional regulator
VTTTFHRMTITSSRQTADERRVTVIDIAFEEFGLSGLNGASTDTIARRAGISQPYLFRLFGTKKELFLAAVEHGFTLTRDAMLEAARGHSGMEALKQMGDAYYRLLEDKRCLRLQLQAYVASEDPEVRTLVRREFGELVEAIQGVTGMDAIQLRDFMARGMLLNVVASLDLMDETTGWAGRLADACREPL